ncbi:KpsF/GutQ family sugar-phosphate isomerase [Salipiger sp. P9]|uniref:KpsF/GutQ family sugar-phosphate isomerase n=1 Tax=Salipiger pentaromativorans TaxID=2943193 RepID=UPI00215716E3|nr:KpsF/GutQ family sugar-phosphate isomerase [Salipiger pentaromativorans]MCR8550887.1 KpsF/GutQ family sugar-phosphate isomerase [Salipiger pentaromativorans]
MSVAAAESEGATAQEPALDAARRVLTIEADALSHLAANLPADFAGAVQKVLTCQGRVIVSGIGKSGHIGRKIAATLASTGTPSYFVHCAEASHGDLGMITQDDICLLISNSGETAELRDIVYHTQRFSIPMISITSNPDSTLAQAADFRLTLPKLPEACPIGMAPTTSTTLTLALGDALAVALMEERGFVAEDFGVFHPGGKLGAQMRRVSELMHSGDTLPVLDHSATMQEVLLTMTSKGFGIAALIEHGKLSGVITDGDLRRNMDKLMQSSPAEIANPDPVTVTADMLAAEALALLNDRKITSLLVIDEAKHPVGVLHMHDFLRAGVV